MTESEKMEIRNQAAESDLRRAKREGEILIGRTLKGTVKLAVCSDGYLLVTQGLNPKTLAVGKRAVVKAELAKLYDIVQEN